MTETPESAEPDTEPAAEPDQEGEPALPARRRRTPMIVALSVIAVIVLGTAAAVLHAGGRTAIDGTPKAFPYLPPSNLAIVDKAGTKAVVDFVTSALGQVLSHDYRDPDAIQRTGKQPDGREPDRLSVLLGHAAEAERPVEAVRPRGPADGGRLRW